MKLIRQTVMLGIVAVLLMSCGIKTLSASELNFAVIPQKPKNQIDMKKGYFDLKVKPNQQQELTVLLKNTTNKAVTIKPKIAATTTNNGGVVEYGPTDKKADQTLKHNITDIVTTEKKVTIKADSTYKLKLKVKAPQESFKGSVTGGLTLEEEVKADDKKSSGSGMSINNRYSYVVGIELREDTSKVKPELKLNKVEPSQRNYRNIIGANIQNIKPTYVNQLKVTAEITKKDSDTVLYQSKKEKMQMAPNSNFDFPVELGEGKELKPGTYTLNMVAKSYKNEWRWTKDFTISGEVAKALNDKDVTIEKSYLMYYIVGGIVLLLLMGLILFFILKKRKKQEENNEI